MKSNAFSMYCLEKRRVFAQIIVTISFPHFQLGHWSKCIQFDCSIISWMCIIFCVCLAILFLYIFFPFPLSIYTQFVVLVRPFLPFSYESESNVKAQQRKKKMVSQRSDFFEIPMPHKSSLNFALMQKYKIKLVQYDSCDLQIKRAEQSIECARLAEQRNKNGEKKGSNNNN